MITGNKPRRIKSYLEIDRNAEGCPYTLPDEGETFIGYPHGYHWDGSAPLIEVIKDNQLVRTVNAMELVWIKFADGERPTPGTA